MTTPMTATDLDILTRKRTRLDAAKSDNVITVGDFVRFSCGTLERVAYVWDASVQTCDLGSGSFYLSEGHCSFSGGLNAGSPREKITLTNEYKDGKIWFFKRDDVCANNSIDALIPFRVWDCATPSLSFNKRS